MGEALEAQITRIATQEHVVPDVCDHPITDRTFNIARALSSMIEIDTVSHRDERDLSRFRAFHERLHMLFPHFFAVAEVEDFDGSLLMRWPGKEPDGQTGQALDAPQDAPILLMNHHDVAEAQGEWTHGAFHGDIAEGRVWGRGALDTKGGLCCMLMAADELAAEGFVPAHDIYFESGCNEETTGNGAHAIADELERRGIRFSFVLDEGGMILYDPIGGAKATFAMVGMGEKGCCELRFIARGSGGHASAPATDTPLVVLGKFMAELDGGKIFETAISPVIKEMFRSMAPYMEGVLGRVFANPDLFEPVLKRAMPAVSPTANALLRTTLAFTMAEGASERNVIPAEAWVIGNMRTAHHQEFENSLAAVKKVADKYGIEIEVLDPGMNTNLTDVGSAGFQLIRDAVDKTFPGVVTAPYIMTGASDCRYMEKLSDNCYRFVPFIISEEQMESIHGIDECVDINTLEPAVDFYRYILTNA